MTPTDARILAQLADAGGPVLLPSLVAALPPLTGREVTAGLRRLTTAGYARTWPPPPGCPPRWGNRYEATAAGAAEATGAQLQLGGMPARPAVAVQPHLFDPPTDTPRSFFDVAADWA